MHDHSRHTSDQSAAGPSDAPHAHAEGCAHAHDHAARAPYALARAEEACRTRGERMTPVRRRVLETLYVTHRPLSAYDIAEIVPEVGDKRLSPVSIYRALDFLMAQGFVHRLESRNAFIACPAEHAPGDVVVFMICDRCGGVDERHSEELRAALGRLADGYGFAPRSRIIELNGACAHCRGEAA